MRTRFAPSPTGYLHLGHAVSAWAVAAAARAAGGEMLLRIEDIDPARCKPEFTAAIVEDLAWLGLEYDGEVLHQSARMADYAPYIAQLKAQGLLYPCTCTRKQVLAVSAGMGPDGPLYGGTCKGKEMDAGAPVAWRLDMAAAVARARAIAPLNLDARPWGDLILVRRETPTSYHLACVIDDALQGITHVVRGEDLRGITAVHELLQVLFGFPRPTYAYHRLITHGDGKKLSKSERAPSLRDLRAQGVSVDELERVAFHWDRCLHDFN